METTTETDATQQQQHPNRPNGMINRMLRVGPISTEAATQKLLSPSKLPGCPSVDKPAQSVLEKKIAIAVRKVVVNKPNQAGSTG